MPNCDYYAVASDHCLVIEHLVAAVDCDIYELYSRPGHETTRFRSISDFQLRYQISDWNNLRETIHLQIYPHAAKGTVQQRRVILKNLSSPETSFRYATEGWGLVQLHLAVPKNGVLEASHTNHNTEKRALAWHDTYPDWGHPTLWDWDAVTSFSRRLNSFIRKQSVAKLGSRVILPASSDFQYAGHQLWPS